METKTYIHPTTGDRVTVLVDTTESAGACFRFEYDARTVTAAPDDHVHPEEEHLEVLAGTLHCRIGGTARVLAAGESLDIAAGAPHAVWHGGPGISRSVGEYRPAGGMQRLLEAYFGATS